MLKQVKNMFTLTVFLKVRNFTLQGLSEPFYIKGVQKQPFVDDLQNKCSWKFCKTHMPIGTPSQVFSYVFCEIFKNTYFLTTPQN